jgi:ElaB/YqjD/DUF883 family membrane-anchored ribosome-binding protein
VDNELEVIRDEMEQTRANLADKLGALENQVRETVSGATEAVSSTVDGVKDVVSSVSETVESVTDTFNVSKHVEKYPWMAMGTAVATGFVLAQVLSRASEPAPASAPVPTPSEPYPQPAAAPQPAERKEEHGLMDSLGKLLPDLSGVMNTVVGSLGTLAVGSLMGVIREMASGGLPKEWQGDVTKLIDQVTTQLGGKPLDSARSSQLFGALGLSGEKQDGQNQAAPSDAIRQQGEQGSSFSGDTGRYGTRPTGRQPVAGR